MIISLVVTDRKVKNTNEKETYPMTPEIIYEDSHIIVCRKPAGIPTQSGRIGMPDMVSILKNHLAAQRKNPYLAVIHRLDQPVEGLLVFAKTPAAARELNRQLTSSGFGKYYRAVVTGVLALGGYTGRSHGKGQPRQCLSHLFPGDSRGKACKAAL